MCDMKRVGLLLIVLLYTSFSFAQKKHTVLKGYLGVAGGESYTYILDFTDSSGYISGHSLTYLYETKEVKAAIEGQIDRDNRTLRFRETSILYNNGFESDQTICLINALLKRQKGSDGNDRYAGAITSSDAGNVYCGQGTVSFPVTAVLDEVFRSAPEPAAKPAEAAKKERPGKPITIVYDTGRPVRKSAPLVPQGPDRITEGTEKTIDWHTESVVIELWDGGQIDGDKISITLNGKPLLSDHTLERAHKRIVSLPLPEGISELVFTAVNEGNQPPMTADIWLLDGDRKHDLLVYNSVGRKAVVRIRKH